MYSLDLQWDRPSAINTQSRDHVLRIRVTPTESSEGIPLRVAIAVDTSLSMKNAGKLDAAKQACSTIIGMLRPEDRLSVASFSTGVETLLSDLPGRNDVEAATQAISQLEAEGKTRTDLALDWIGAALRPEERALCVGFIITDGHATDRTGRKLEDLTQLIEQADRIAETGVSLYTVGLGDASKFNQEFLVDIGDKGRGAFLFAESAHQLQDQLKARFARTQSMADANGVLTIRKSTQQLAILRCCRLKPDYVPLIVTGRGSTAAVNIGALAARTPTDILLRVHPPGLMFGEPLGSRDVLDLSLEVAGKQIANQTVSLKYTASYTDAQIENPEVNRDRQVWDIKVWNDDLIRVTDPIRTRELLENIRDAARKTGVLDVAASADKALEDLWNTGELEATVKTRTTTAIRSSSGDVA